MKVYIEAYNRKERLTKATVLLSNKLMAKHGLDYLFVRNSNLDTPSAQKRIHVYELSVHKSMRKQGRGSGAMKDVTAFADRHKLTTTLDLASKDLISGTTSKERLRRFYSRFGFKSNKGRNKDYTTQATMIRRPKAEAVDPKLRKERIAKLWHRAEIHAGTRAVMMDAKATGWNKYGDKAHKAARIATAYDHKPYDSSRRARLAKILSKARSGFAAVRDGSRKDYKPAAKAFKVYKKFRFDHSVTAKRQLTPGGLVHDPGRSFEVLKSDFIADTSKYRPSLVVKNAKTKPIRFPDKPSDGNPSVAAYRHGAKRLAKKFADSPVAHKAALDTLMRRFGLSSVPPKPKDKSTTLPGGATMDPKEKRITNPKIHQPKPKLDTMFDLARRGDHPMSYMIKKNIGRKERKAWSGWVKPKETDLW